MTEFYVTFPTSKCLIIRWKINTVRLRTTGTAEGIFRGMFRNHVRRGGKSCFMEDLSSFTDFFTAIGGSKGGARGAMAPPHPKA